MGAGASSSGLSVSGRQSPPQLETPLIYANESYAYLLAACRNNPDTAAAGGGGGRRSGKKSQGGASPDASAAQAFLTHEQKIARASALLKMIFAVSIAKVDWDHEVMYPIHSCSTESISAAKVPSVRVRGLGQLRRLHS
jgi:hypothetical protein